MPGDRRSMVLLTCSPNSRWAPPIVHHYSYVSQFFLNFPEKNQDFTSVAANCAALIVFLSKPAFHALPSFAVWWFCSQKRINIITLSQYLQFRIINSISKGWRISSVCVLEVWVCWDHNVHVSHHTFAASTQALSSNSQRLQILQQLFADIALKVDDRTRGAIFNSFLC